MALTVSQRERIAAEMKRFSSELSLSDTQKEKLSTILTEIYEKLQKFGQENPNISKEELVQMVTANRSALRERVVTFLSAQQLEKWDVEIAKTKDFLAQKAATA